MALGPQDIANLNRFGNQLQQSVSQMNQTAGQMNATFNTFADRLENIIGGGGEFEEGVERAGKTFKGELADAAKIFDKMIGGTASRFAKVIGGFGKASGLAVVGSLVATIFKNFEGIRRNTALVTRQTGIMTGHSQTLAETGQALTRDLAAYAGQWQLVGQTVAGMAGSYATIQNISSETGLFATYLEQAYGVASKDLGVVMGTLQDRMGFSAELAKLFVAELAIGAEDYGFTLAETVNQAASGAEVLAFMGGKSWQQMKKVVLESKKLGLNMQWVQNEMQQQTQYEDTLRKTMRANVFLGTKMNARQIMSAKLSGDVLKTLDLTVGAAAKQYKFSDLNAIQVRELMQLSGLTASELERQFFVRRGEVDVLSDALLSEEKRVKLEAKAADLQKDAHEAMSRQAGVMQQLSREFISGILEPIQKWVNNNYGGFEGFLDDTREWARYFGDQIGKLIESFLSIKSIAAQVGIVLGVMLAPLLPFGKILSGLKATPGLLSKLGGGGKAGLLSTDALGTTSKFGKFAGSTAGKVAGGAGLAVSAVMLGKNIYDAFTKQGVKKKKATGKAIGGGIGMAIGAVLGGPVGASIGYTVGAFVGDKIGESMVSSADRLLEQLAKETAELEAEFATKKGVAGLLRESISLGFQDNEAKWKNITSEVLNAVKTGGAFTPEMLILINKTSGSLEAFLKLSPEDQFRNLQQAAKDLSQEFKDAVIYSAAWQSAEAKVREGESKIRLLELEKKRAALSKEFATYLEPDELATFLNQTTGGKKFATNFWKEFLEDDNWDDNVKWLLDKADIKGGIGRKSAALGVVGEVLKKERTGGAETDMLKTFKDSLNMDQVLSMTHKSILESFDLFFNKSFAEVSVEGINKIVSGLNEQRNIVESPAAHGIEVKDFVIPSGSDTVVGFDAGKLPMGNTAEAINKLATALESQEITIQFPSGEIEKVLINKAFKS